MSKPYRFLRKEITRIKEIQGQIIALVSRNWNLKKSTLQILQSYLITNAHSEEEYSLRDYALFEERVLKIIHDGNKQSNLVSKIEIMCFILGFLLLTGRRVVLAVNRNTGLSFIQDEDSFLYISRNLGLASLFFALALEAFSNTLKKMNIEKTMQERVKFQSEISNILTLLQELEEACENLSFYRRLCGNPSLISEGDVQTIVAQHPMRYIPLEFYRTIRHKIRKNFTKAKNSSEQNKFKGTPTGSMPIQADEAIHHFSLEENKSEEMKTTKPEKIAEKIAIIKQYISQELVVNDSSKSTHLMIKMPIQELENKLIRVKDLMIKNQTMELVY